MSRAIDMRGKNPNLLRPSQRRTHTNTEGAAS